MMNKILLAACLILSSFSINAKASDGPSLPEVRTVSSVDLSRYAGKWFQIAFFPTIFQGSCTINTTATYGILPDGKVSVFNECYKPNGKYKSISGSARVVDGSNSKLKVKFFWFAPAGDYWIINLDPNYQYAVVGSPDRKFLWILARTPSITNSLYQELLKSAADQYFDVSRVQLTSTLLPN